MKLCNISPPYLCGEGKGSNILYIWIVHTVINWYKLSKNKVGGEILNKNVKDILAIVIMQISHLPASALIGMKIALLLRQPSFWKLKNITDKKVLLFQENTFTLF